MNVNKKDEDERTPLHWYVHCPPLRATCTHTRPSLAATGRQLQGTRPWVSSPALSDAMALGRRCDRSHDFVLCACVRCEVEYLVSKGAKVDTVDDSGWSPLLSAASAGKTDTVSYVRDVPQSHTLRKRISPGLTLFTLVVPLQLLKHGADVNQENENER